MSAIFSLILLENPLVMLDFVVHLGYELLFHCFFRHLASQLDYLGLDVFLLALKLGLDVLFEVKFPVKLVLKLTDLAAVLGRFLFVKSIMWMILHRRPRHSCNQILPLV